MATEPSAGTYFDREKLRARMLAIANQWVDNLPLEELCANGKAPTLRDMSTMLLEERSTLIGPILYELIVQIAASCDHKRMSCPQCKRTLFRKRMEKKCLLTTHGKLHIERAYFYCEQCANGYHPLDEMIDLAREVHQYDVQMEVTRLAADMPYDHAVATFERLTKQKVSPPSVHEHAQQFEEVATAEVVLPDQATVERKIAAIIAEANGETPVLVVSADGAFTPTRPEGKRKGKRGKGKWRDAKGFRLFLINRRRRIVSLASWHNIEPEGSQESITRALEEIAARLPSDKVRIVLIGDGASWVWKLMTTVFPNAKQILDYYHLSQHFWTVAKLLHCDPAHAREWVEATIGWLWEHGPRELIGLLRDVEGPDPTLAKELRKLIEYIEEHANRLDYAEAKKAGRPLGSGGMESANKFLVNKRMKVSGAWWLEANANTMLHLRCAIYNGTFATVFEKYVETRKLKK